MNHNEKAEWLNGIEKELKDVVKQQDIDITPNKIRQQTSKMANWKAPGPDGLQGFWLKYFKSTTIGLTLNKCLDEQDIPDWLTKGKTTLILKDRGKENVVTNFRPITCLPLIWKLLTGILANEMYDHMNNARILPEEQKGCRKNARGTKDQLLIDKMVLKNCKRRQSGLAMGWIDYKKAYDMVPHLWIKKCMEMCGVADNIRVLIERSMEKWETKLTSGGAELGKVKIRRGTFQGDSLSPLLFLLSVIPLSLVLRKVKAGYDLGKNQGVINHLLFMDDLKLYGKTENQLDTLVNTVRIFSSDICMEFGIEKCGMLIMKRGKFVKSEGIKLPNDEKIKEVDLDMGYKYLGILEADGMKDTKMKGNIGKEYLRRVRKILKSKLNGMNCITAINSRAVLEECTKRETGQM